MNTPDPNGATPPSCSAQCRARAEDYLRKRGILLETFTSDGGEIDYLLGWGQFCQRLKRGDGKGPCYPASNELESILWFRVPMKPKAIEQGRASAKTHPTLAISISMYCMSHNEIRFKHRGFWPDCISQSLELVSVRPGNRTVVSWLECSCCGWQSRPEVQYEFGNGNPRPALPRRSTARDANNFPAGSDKLTN
jgi:hypothetical protein